MVQLWMSWCRLCAREDPNKTHINIFKNEEGLPLASTLEQWFAIDMNNISNLPIVICSECYCHIRKSIDLRERVAKVSAMFEDLQITSNYENELDPFTIKARHNLQLDFKLFVTNNCTCSENTCGVEFKNKLPQMDEQMIDQDQELIKCSNYVDSNPIEIKVEVDDAESNSNDHLGTQNEESTSHSSDWFKNHEQKERKKKYRKRSEIESDNLKKPHYCSDCRKGFLKAHNYRRHMQSAHGITIDFNPQLFVCENCGKEYRSISALREHEYSHTEERTHKCKYCEKTFKGIPSLRAHEDTHNETNYICVICGLKLNTQRTLRQHMIVHSDQRKHKCDHCGNEFKRAKALKNHLILHTGLKPYSCEFCDRTFNSGSNCRSHKKKSHPIQLAEQEAAGKKNVLNAEIPKLRELKAATANKTLIGKQNDQQSKEKKISNILKNEVDRPQNETEAPDLFHSLFGKKYLY